VLTSLLGKAEHLNIHCTVKVFEYIAQLTVHFADNPQVDQPTDCSRWQGGISALAKPKVTTYCA
jgi:hypothetical protein